MVFERAFDLERVDETESNTKVLPRGLIHNPVDSLRRKFNMMATGKTEATEESSDFPEDAEFGFPIATLQPGHSFGLGAMLLDGQSSELTFTTRMNTVQKYSKGVQARMISAVTETHEPRGEWKVEEAQCSALCARISRYAL